MLGVATPVLGAALVCVRGGTIYVRGATPIPLKLALKDFDDKGIKVAQACAETYPATCCKSAKAQKALEGVMGGVKTVPPKWEYEVMYTDLAATWKSSIHAKCRYDLRPVVLCVQAAAPTLCF